MKEIKLTQGQFALVDDADFEWLNQWKWHVRKMPNCYYVYRWHKNGAIAMHRLILGLTDPKVFGDHKDGNGLNNQRENLRVATFAQNSQNKKKWDNTLEEFKGIKRNKKGDRWQVIIGANGKQMAIGTFTTKEDAARAYNAKALELHGEFARLNDGVGTAPISPIFLMSNNTSGYKGVRWHKNSKKWDASISFNQKRYCIGSFNDPKEAAYAYDKKSLELHGDRAKLNFPKT